MSSRSGKFFRPEGMSTAARKRARQEKEKRAMVSQGYEPDIPRCGNCTVLLGQCYDTEFRMGHGNRCNLGKFPVQKTGVCDLWESKSGEVLE